MQKILLVDDDRDIVKNLSDFLKAEGFSVVCAGGQREALAKFEEQPCDLALLDISLTDGSGFVLCSALRQKQPALPIIFLTASDDEHSIVAGLDMGADDYIAKPFRPRELVSRIKSVLRRSGRGSDTVLSVQEVSVDTERAVVTKNGQEIFLSALEYRLLLIFFSNKGRVLTRERLLEEIWDAAGEFVNDNTLTVYIKRLREKIEDDPQEPAIIKTVRGIGYKAGGE